MKSKGEQSQKEAVSQFAEQALRLRDKTLSRTASSKDQESRSFDPVLAPKKGGMVSTCDEGVRRIRPPSGHNINVSALEHRDKALQRTPSDTDPKKKDIRLVTAPKKGGMR
jgi:hypothetical protein